MKVEIVTNLFTKIFDIYLYLGEYITMSRTEIGIGCLN